MKERKAQRKMAEKQLMAMGSWVGARKAAADSVFLAPLSIRRNGIDDELDSHTFAVS